MPARLPAAQLSHSLAKPHLLIYSCYPVLLSLQIAYRFLDTVYATYNETGRM